MIRPPDAGRRPAGGRDGDRMRDGDGIITMLRPGCPLVRAAAAGDPAVLAAVARWHPPSRCPAARRRSAP